MWLGAFAAAFAVASSLSLAQGPPGAAAAASVAAAAASVAAPAPKRSASSLASEAAQGNGVVAPARDEKASPKSAEEAANGGIPPEIAALAAKLASGPPLKGVALQCANLLKLATSLKTDVAKSNKDELSIPVVRDAGQIEQMARKMRDDQRH